MEATRQLLWNAPGGYWIYLLAVLPIGLLAFGLYRRLRLWRRGGPDERFDRWGARLAALLLDGFAHRRNLHDRYGGLMHLLIFSGMAVLFVGTVIEAVYHILDLPFLRGLPYLLLSLALDVAGLLVLVGVLMAAWRRYGQRPDKLDNIWDDGLVLGWLFLVLAGGFLVEALRMRATEVAPHPDWARWSPVGFALASLLGGLDPAAVGALHGGAWWSHMVLSLAFVGYLAWSKLLHIFTAPANIFFRSFAPAGALRPIADLETADHFGAGRIEQFTWKHLLDLDACTRCGRCQDNCPAYLSGKPLSPKKLVQDLKRAMEGRAGAEGLVAGAVQEDELWACTTCRACQEACPVFVEHVDKVVEMRRYVTLEESRFPRELRATFDHLEVNGNPWEIAWSSRADWAKAEGVPTLAEAGRADWLYWAGCFASFDSRNRRVAAALVRLMRQAGLDFSVLGTEERCCGDPARRTGNEYLFQMLAQENIERLQAGGVRRIVTACPHCYNTLKNEYPQFGGEFEVLHHTQLLADLLSRGRLQLPKREGLRLTYHDPCYLGRYNDEFDAPRRLLAALPGVVLTEMERGREGSFCCGGGGGRQWMEEPAGRRINGMRVEQALRTDPQAIATACPYCLTILEDGLRAAGANTPVLDLAELLAGGDQAIKGLGRPA